MSNEDRAFERIARRNDICQRLPGVMANTLANTADMAAAARDLARFVWPDDLPEPGRPLLDMQSMAGGRLSRDNYGLFVQALTGEFNRRQQEEAAKRAAYEEAQRQAEEAAHQVKSPATTPALKPINDVPAAFDDLIRKGYTPDQATELINSSREGDDPLAQFNNEPSDDTPLTQSLDISGQAADASLPHEHVIRIHDALPEDDSAESEYWQPKADDPATAEGDETNEPQETELGTPQSEHETGTPGPAVDAGGAESEAAETASEPASVEAPAATATPEAVAVERPVFDPRGFNPKKALAAAFHLAKFNKATFPCKWPSKAPTCPGGFKAATKDETELRSLWAAHPGNLIGLRTGPTNDLAVLDYDPVSKTGVPHLEAQALHAEWQTVGLFDGVTCVSTPRGGRHYYFSHVEGLKCSTGEPVLGIDVKADGGYIIAWSAHGLPIAMGESLPMPQTIIEAVSAKKKPRGAGGGGPADEADRLHPRPAGSAPPDPLDLSGVSSPGEKAKRGFGEVSRKRLEAVLAMAVEEVAKTGEGTRNPTLNGNVHRIARLAAFYPGWLGEERAHKLFSEAASGYIATDGHAAFEKTFNSAWSKGSADPQPLGERAYEGGKPKPGSGASGKVDGADGSGKSGDDELWGSPLPLMREAAPAGPFPIGALGPVLGPAVQAIMHMTQAPDALCAGAVLAAASLAAQVRANIILPIGREGEGEARPLSGYFVTIGETGERKSGVYRLATAAIDKVEREIGETYDSALASHETAMAAWKKARENIEKINSKETRPEFIEAALRKAGPPPLPPLMPTLTVKEPTFEGLRHLLEVGVGSLGLFSGEGGSFLGGYAMRAENKLGTAAGLSDIWDGDVIKAPRASKPSPPLWHRRLSMHLMVQPEVAAGLLDDDLLRGQGLRSRLLVAYPQSTMGARNLPAPSPEARRALGAYDSCLEQLIAFPWAIMRGKRNELDPRGLVLDPKAIWEWQGYVMHLETQLGAEGRLRPVSGLANKAPEIAARLAGSMALMEDCLVGVVTSEGMQRGIALAEFYLAENLRLLDASRVSPELAEAQKLLDWLLRRRRRFVPLAEVYQYGPRPIRTRARALRNLDILGTHGWVRPVRAGTATGEKARGEVWEVWLPE